MKSALQYQEKPANMYLYHYVFQRLRRRFRYGMQNQEVVFPCGKNWGHSRALP